MNQEDPPPPPRKAAETPAPAEDRKARLAAALRDNLKRRKAQSRAKARAPRPASAAGNDTD